MEGEIMDPRRANNRGVRLDFPHFNGDNPTESIFKVNQYFSYHQTQPGHRLLMASYHMQGEALIWYQDAWDSGHFDTWETFTRALQLRFGPTDYYDPMEALTCLKQTSTLATYKAQFESLSNRLKRLPENHKLSCFISGLKDGICLPIRYEGEEEEELLEGNEETNLEMESKTLEPGAVGPEISLNALARIPNSTTMMPMGQISRENVVILVDSSSTHSFLNLVVARKTRLKVDP
ncbi:uncharacterized protein LOC121249543 [Juglans microcarpa x Juglans regia]|uniref:uncharacterized protein LOC121249543 n=1 Tax=Juglans microcarpa x Juglans regia TaxID=2249226 RepID=UPI001B7F39D1|nr:uncharacterized protein LOC121249543 [Juglans microcarpa x Juglans regia]